MLFSIAVLALLASVQGRAVNISNTWVLPEEGFPVFYRYFRDRISWYEADAVCQFHHANLVTVDTTAQYDAVRAYLKELDISSAVWVGLIRSNPDGDFTWTDYRGLSSEGYWSSAPDSRSAPLCAAADPAADYRWEARACGGPTVASFICELPVPQWALGNEGCMIRALPALTILYLPESAAVQLTADCGMAGVKKVQCTGNVKREDLLKELSCADEEEPSTTSNSVSTGSNWPDNTDSPITDQDTTANEVTSEEALTTEHENIYQPEVIIATSKPSYIYTDTHFKSPKKFDNFNSYNILSKNINLGENINNIHSNFIPKIMDDDNGLTNDQLDKLEDERNMQHKMLHEEIARVGNVENIFTQPTDHFIPPLVMAKARISDDMTVLSLAEKHAQQLAEKHFGKQMNNNPIDNSYSENYKDKVPVENIDKPLITSFKPNKVKDAKKEAIKTNLPKKYINEKHYDVKSKTFKNIETKTTEAYKPTETSSTTESTTKDIETTTKRMTTVDDDLGMELTVLLKDAPLTSEETSFSGDVSRLETIKSNHVLSNLKPEILNLDNSNQSNKTNIATTTTHPEITDQTQSVTTKNNLPTTPEVENITMKHEVITITIVTDTPSVTTNVFEITTKTPVFKDYTTDKTPSTPLPITQFSDDIHSSSVSPPRNEITTTATTKLVEIENATTTTSPVSYSASTTITTVTEKVMTTLPPVITSTVVINVTESISTTHTPDIQNKTEEAKTVTVAATTFIPITTTDVDKNVNDTTTHISNESIERSDYNITEIHDVLVLDKNMTDSEEIDDFQSPLLSGAVEPMHRPPRTRRPQQPNRNKFNPFRILG